MYFWRYYYMRYAACFMPIDMFSSVYMKLKIFPYLFSKKEVIEDVAKATLLGGETRFQTYLTDIRYAMASPSSSKSLSSPAGIVVPP